MDYQFIYDQCSEGIKIFDKAKILVDDGNKDSAYSFLSEQLRNLQERFSEQKLTILVAGEMKAGKSTFINSLLGVNLLATAHEVCTNVPTKIVYGEEEKITVHFIKSESGILKKPKEITREQVAEYSTETGNKENQKNVDYIEIQAKSQLLAEGLAFIDTPGLGAVDPLHAIATYRMASQADIIFFLGDSRKSLTQSEITSLKDLIKVSDCNQILNLLTFCDMKSTEDIFNSNQKIFYTDFSDYNIPIIKVSSLMYNKYIRSGNRKQLDGSGFQHVKSYVADINNDLKAIINSRFCALAFQICLRGNKLLYDVIEAAEDPVAKEQQVEKLQDLLNRLSEIEENQSNWQLELNEKQQLFAEELKDFIRNQQTKITNNVNKNLESDSYLEDKDALSKSITADLVKFQSDLNNTISDGFVKIYQWLREETGLKKIQEESIETPNTVSTTINIGKDIGKNKSGQKIQGLYRSILIGGGIATVAGAAGNWAGSIAGAKVGALIGGVFAPGIGNVIGGAVGAIAGAIAGVVAGFSIFKGSKEERKQKKHTAIFNECKKQIIEFFNKTQSEVNKAKIAQSTDLAKQFLSEIRGEKKRLQLRKHQMHNLAQRVKANYEAIKKLVDSSKSICDNLQKK